MMICRPASILWKDKQNKIQTYYKKEDLQKRTFKYEITG